jgi:hypothetical protein
MMPTKPEHRRSYDVGYGYTDRRERGGLMRAAVSVAERFQPAIHGHQSIGTVAGKTDPPNQRIPAKLPMVISAMRRHIPMNKRANPRVLTKR